MIGMRTHLTPPLSAHRRWMRRVLLSVTAFIALGLILMIPFHNRFLFYWDDQYGHVQGWGFFLLLPMSLVLMLSAEFRNNLHDRYPTWWVRWLFMYPLTAIVLPGLAVTAPLGWIELSVWALGDARVHVFAKVVELDHFHQHSKGCRQYVKLVVGSTKGKICVRDVFDGQTPQVGQTVELQGRESRLGFMVERIVTR